MWSELRYSVRSLARNPSFSVLAVLSLSLGIGATVTIYSAVQTLLLEALPFPEPDRLVMIWESNLSRDFPRNEALPSNFVAWRERSTSFEEMAAVLQFEGIVKRESGTEEIEFALPHSSLFRLLKVDAEVGRAFSPDENRDVVMLSYGYWQRAFGADPSVVGEPLNFGQSSLPIVGVAPKSLALLAPDADVWMPSTYDWANRGREGHIIRVVGRLRPEIEIETAASELNAIAMSLQEEFPEDNEGWGVSLVPLQDELVGSFKPALLISMGAVALLLLISCANVAGLLITRNLERRYDLALRSALGANRSHLVRSALTESLVLSGCGALGGIVLAAVGIQGLLLLTPLDFRPPDVLAIELDLGVLGFCIALALTVGLVVGVFPAFAACRVGVAQALGQRSVAVGRHGRGWAQGGLVVAQLGLTLVLLSGSGLLLRSFLLMVQIDSGVQPDGLLTMRIHPEEPKDDFYRSLLSRLEQLPGVLSASAVQFVPLGGDGAGTFFVVEGQPQPELQQAPVTDIQVVADGYFRTMGIPLSRGRTLDSRDHAEAPHVIVVNETLARQAWPGGDPIGRQLSYWIREFVPLRVVGVVGDILHEGLDVPVRPRIYLPLDQNPRRVMTLVVRSENDPESALPMVLAEISALDRGIAVSDIRSMNSLLSGAVTRPRFSAALFVLFAAVALVLAATGIYGVVNRVLAHRRKELGIRLALGASPRDLVSLVLGSGARLVALGLIAGALGTAASAHLLSGLLFGVGKYDALTLLIAVGTLVTVSLLASYVPARRASRLDPVASLTAD